MGQALSPAILAADSSDAQNTQNDINNLNVQLAEAVNRYSDASNRLDDLNAQMSQNQQDMDASARDLAKSLHILNKRAAGIYKRGNVSSLEVLFNSKSIDDLVQQLDLLSRVGNRDGVVVKQVEAQKKAIEVKARELAAQRQEQQKLTNDLSAQRDAINAQLGDKQNVLASILADLVTLDDPGRDRPQAPPYQKTPGATLTNPLPGGDWGQLAPGESSDHYKYGGSGHGVWLYEYSNSGSADAMDIGGPGDIVYAAHSGTVIWSSGSSSGVTIIQGGGYITCYAHSEPFYGEGASITEGQAIASVNLHLHFELLDNGNYVPAGSFQTYF